MTRSCSRACTSSRFGTWLAFVLTAACLAAGCGDETVRRDWPERREGDGALGRAIDRGTTPTSPREVPADALPASALVRGRFLIAARRLQSDFFARSVVLLLDYSSPTGAFGVIVNRPTGLGLTDLLPALDSVPERLDRVNLGGPVDPGRMVFLIRSASPPRDSWPVFADVHATSGAGVLRSAIERNEPPARFRAFVGYAGWSPGQLDEEVARGDWYVVPADPEQVFDPRMEDLWDRLVEEHEGVRVDWSAEAATRRLCAKAL